MINHQKCLLQQGSAKKCADYKELVTKIVLKEVIVNKKVPITKKIENHLSPTFSASAKPVVVLAHLGFDLSKFDHRLEIFQRLLKAPHFSCATIRRDLIKTFVMAS